MKFGCPLGALAFLSLALSSFGANVGSSLQQASNTPNLLSLDGYILCFLMEFVDDVKPLARSCKFFWNFTSLLMLFHLYGHGSSPFSWVEECSLIQSQNLVGASLTSMVSAFGVPKRPLSIDNIARNLCMFAQSSAFREVFTNSLWSRLRTSQVYLQQCEQLEMFRNDLPRRQWRTFDRSLVKNVMARLHVLASLPLESDVIIAFLNETPFPLIHDETVHVFDSLKERIVQRLLLVPVSLLVDRYLQILSFHSDIVGLLVDRLVKSQRFRDLKTLLSRPIPNEYRHLSHPYLGCVRADLLASAIETSLNTLRDPLAVDIVTAASRSIRRMRVYLKPRECESAELGRKFHAFVLHHDWDSLRGIFADSELAEQLYPRSFDFLSTMEPEAVMEAIRECPEITGLHTLLLDHRYQMFHFNTPTHLPRLREALKAVCSYPDVLAAFLRYTESNRPLLYESLVNDSLARINEYFGLTLESTQRKRYKEHPSFVIAIMVLDGFLARNLESAHEISEYYDKETVLRDFLIELNILPDKLDNYFELAHAFPSFCEAMMPLKATATHELLSDENIDLAKVAEYFRIRQVITDGGFIRYDLIIESVRRCGLVLSHAVVPVELLRHFVKSAAFYMKKTRHSSHIPFKPSQELNLRRDLLILTIQQAGRKAATRKAFKNHFHELPLDEGLFAETIDFYNEHLSQSHYLPTNNESEAFVMDLAKCLFATRPPAASLEETIASALKFLQIDPQTDTLLIPQLKELLSIAAFELCK